MRVTPPLVALGIVALLAASTAHAAGTADVGSGHWLLPQTRVHVDVHHAGEGITVRASTADGRAAVLQLLVAGAAAEQLVLSDDSAVDRTPGPGRHAIVVDTDPPGGLTALSVEVHDAAGAPRPGRVSSLRWQFDTQSYLVATDARFWVADRSPSGADRSARVWRLEVSGFAGHQFQVSANARGLEAPWSGRSAPAPGPRFLPQFDVYTEPPDLDAVPADNAGLLAITRTANGLRVETSAGGELRVAADLDGDGVAGNAPREQLLVASTLPGVQTLAWRDVDGEGAPLPVGALDCVAQLRTGELHFVAFDVETSLPGVRIHRVDASGPVSTAMFWDDGSVDDGTIAVASAQGLVSGDPDAVMDATTAHGWGGPIGTSEGPGNLTWIDTWVQGDLDERTFVVTIGGAADAGPPDAGPAPSPVDAGALAPPDFLPPMDGWPADWLDWITPDEGAPYADGGPGADGGTPPAPPADAGPGAAPPDASDAGLVAVVAAPPPSLGAGRDASDDLDASGFVGGWGCGAAPGGVKDLALLVLLVLLARRRTRRARALALLFALSATPARAVDVDGPLPGPSSASVVTATASGTATPSQQPGGASVMAAGGLATHYALHPITRGFGRPALAHLLVATPWIAWAPVRALWLDASTSLLWAPPTPGNELLRGLGGGDLSVGAAMRVAGAVDGARALQLLARARVPVAALAGATPFRADGAPLVGGGRWGGGLGVAGHVALHPRALLAARTLACAATDHGSHLEASMGVKLNPTEWLSVPIDVGGQWYVDPHPSVLHALPAELRALPTLHLGPVRVGVLLGVGLTGGAGAPLARAGLVLEGALDRAAASPVATRPAPVEEDTPTQAAVAPSPAHVGEPLTPWPAEPLFEAATRAPSFRVSLLFATDSDALDDEARAHLALLARWLSSASAAHRFTVVVEGHADPRGEEEHNLDLSLRRAHAVALFLETQGVDVPVVLGAFGERRATQADDPEAWAHDRRVDVTARASDLKERR